MALLSQAEFTEAVTLLADHVGVERLRERLARMNAFTSRRGLGSAAAIAERLHVLTGGLRRTVPATYAFSMLWNQMVQERLGTDGEKELEALADRVNACLDEQERLVPGKEDELDQALASYRERLAAATGPRVALVDMLLKAVPDVAERLRRATPPGAAAPAAE
jgi:hypothetical protein